VLALEDGIDALRGSQHGRADGFGRNSVSQYQVNGLGNAGRHLRGRWGLGLGQHAAMSIKHDRISIRAADIDAKP